MTDTNILKQCWAIALDLDVDDINNDDNFFDLGGDSVQAIRLAEVAREHGLKLDVETVFNHPDCQDMLANSEKVATTDIPSEAPSQGQLNPAILRACADTCGVEPELIEDIFPTVGVQSSLMQIHIHSGAFLMQLVFELSGTRDTALVRKAFEIIRDKNQALRTRLVQMDSEMLQVALKDPIVWHNAVDLEGYKAKDSTMWMGYGQPLVRHAVVQELEKTYIIWTCHHSLMDGWTRRLLLDDLKSYLVDPVAFTAKPDRPPFKDLLGYQRSYKTEADAFFERYYAELPHTKTLYNVPENYTANPNNSTARKVSIDRPTRNAFTVSVMAHAAFALALGQTIGTGEVTLNTIRGSRAISMPGAESIMGPLVSSALLHVQLPPKEPVSTVLRSIQDTTTRMLKYDFFSREHRMRQPGHLNHIAFNWFPIGTDLFSRTMEFTVGDDKALLKVSQELYPNPHYSFGCVINIYDNGDHLRVSSSFDDRLLEASLLERLLDLFAAKLRRICEGQEMSVESLMT